MNDFFTAKGCEVWRKGNAENAEVAERGGEGTFRISNIERRTWNVEWKRIEEC
jgi:hypothetical protein